MFAGAARRAVSTLRHRFGPEPDWLKHKRSVDHLFDVEHGVDTGGITSLKTLGIAGDSWREGVDHIAVDPGEFAAAIASLDLDLSNFNFIDLGSGKGRALILASRHPFKRIIGVEFAASLIATARSNLRGHPVELVHSDVLEYDFPPEPAVIFLYNPFGPSVMRQVAARIRASLDQSPRETAILYLNPFQLDAWTDNGFRQVFRGGYFAVLLSEA